MVDSDTRFLSPPEIGKILGCGAEKVLQFIAKGELKAINTSLSERARWKIHPEDFEAFCNRRANVVSTMEKTKARRARRVFNTPTKNYFE